MRIIKEFPWCKEYGITEVTVDVCLCNPDYITIWKFLNEDVTKKEKIQFVLLSLLYFNF